VYDVKSTSQPDTIALLGNNYNLQIIETGFAEQFYAFHRMGPAPFFLKISARIAERETYRMILLKTRLFSHWSIPLSVLERTPVYKSGSKVKVWKLSVDCQTSAHRYHLQADLFWLDCPFNSFYFFRLPFLQPQEYIMFSWVQSVSVSPFLTYSAALPTVLRVRNVYPRSRIRIFSIPDPEFFHPGSASKNSSI
jgi:hypothetical protein